MGGDCVDSTIQAKKAAISRKRASKACLKCRNRKVRCDVTVNGYPCTNCRLDGFSCEVIPHAKGHLRGKSLASLKTLGVVPHKTGSDDAPTRDIAASESSPILGLDFDFDLDLEDEPVPSLCVSHDTDSDKHTASKDHDQRGSIIPVPPAHVTQALNENSISSLQKWTEVKLPDAWRVCDEDILQRLHSEMCFYVPCPSILAQFLNEYALHVHQMLPLLEKSSIDALTINGEVDMSSWTEKPLQLLVLQSILFAASAYIPEKYLEKLQIRSVRDARALFYKKAKLLYQCSKVTEHLSMAQASLLLTYWCPAFSSDRSKPNSAWLRTAIRHARAIGAPEHAKCDDPDNMNSLSIEAKRLWWCCTIRDRILSLCVRRPIQIPKHESTLDPCSMLGAHSQKTSITGSPKLSSPAGNLLSKVLVLLARLCLDLAGPLELVYGRWEQSGSVDATLSQLDSEAQSCSDELKTWFENANAQTSSLRAERIQLSPIEQRIVSVSLNIVWIYYYSARLALYNYRLRLSLQLSTKGRPEKDAPSHRELYSIMESFVSCLGNILSSPFSHSLPSSIVGCSAFPLAMHLLILRSRASHGRGRDPGWTRISRQLEILQQTMENCRHVYDGVDWVTKVIEYFMDCTYLDDEEEEQLIPTHYLRMALTIDLSIREDRLPVEDDFPQQVKSLILQGGCFMPILFEQAGALEPTDCTPISDEGCQQEAETQRLPEYLDGWIANDRSLFFAYEMGLAP